MPRRPLDIRTVCTWDLLAKLGIASGWSIVNKFGRNRDVVLQCASVSGLNTDIQGELDIALWRPGA